MNNFFKRTKKKLGHLFTPSETNNWRAKSIQNDTLTYLVVFLIAINIGFRFLIGHTANNILGVSIDLSVQELLNDTNVERQKYGLKPLILNPSLISAAKDKGQDMFQNNYWAHFSPTGVSPWYFFEKNNYDYSYAGENLAKDFTTSSDVIKAWMNSEKHKENILKPEYEEVGFSIVEGTLLGQPTIIVVQMFGKQENSELANKPLLGNLSKEIKNNNEKPKNSGVVQSEKIEHKPLIDLRFLQKQIVFFILSGLIIALSIDLYVIDKKQVFRFSGKNLAHLLFIILFILGLIVIKQGTIL